MKYSEELLYNIRFQQMPTIIELYTTSWNENQYIILFRGEKKKKHLKFNIGIAYDV